MKLYKTTITPNSNFATSLKGDTLFGQMCWAIFYLEGKEVLNELLSTYSDKPFLVVSDAFANGYLPKPHLPSGLLGEDSDLKKENRKNVWLTLDKLQKGEFSEAITNEDANNEDKKISIIHNSINYETFTTGADGFDPYGIEEHKLSKKDIYFLISDDFASERLNNTFEFISLYGYGKKSSTGKGRFTFCEFELIEFKHKNSTSFMALSAFTPYHLDAKVFYEPFTRFGKHGANLANKNPFKKPLLLADVGAVVIFNSSKTEEYIGSSILGHSTHSGTVHQGYSIVVPLKDIKL